ncbi:MAG: hypothetical protein MAG795_00339 [Candidatus Woesearchaeota archaeon]|nr:hypothetical protein [Candidatus Woesearchaeota archaeon]
MLIIIGAIIRLVLAFMYYPSGDACTHISIARYIAENNKIPFIEPGRVDKVFWAPPLFHILLAIFKGSFGSFSMKLISPISGIGVMILSYKIADSLFNKKIAYYTLSFMTFIPIMIFQSTIAYVDNLSLLLMMFAIYFAVKKNITLSAIFTGLSILSKYNSIFIFPVVMFILFKKKVLFKHGKFFKISLPISSIWFIRNYLILKNPVYPFLSHFFKTEVTAMYTNNTSFLNLLSLKHALSLFLNLYGVPEGKYSNLFFFNFQYIKLFVALWFLGTALYLVFAFIGLSKFKFKKRWQILSVWFISFAIMILAYIVHNGYTRLRYGIGIIPVIAILWALGFDWVLKKKKIPKWALYSFIIICAIGFIGTELTKTYLAAQQWTFFEEDFDWIKNSTSEDSLLYIRKVDCIYYNTNRKLADSFDVLLDNGGYYWIKDEIEDDSIYWLPKVDITKYEDNLVLVYNNSKTQSLIYEVKPVGKVS